MLTKSTKSIITTAAKADGIPTDRIAAAIAVLEQRPDPRTERQPMFVNQAEAARRLSISRLTLRKMVKQGRIKQVEFLPGLIRFSVAELERLALGAD